MMGAVRSLLIGRQIQTVVSALEDAGIPVLLLKGPALARTEYPDPATRQSSYIDILVKSEVLYKCDKVFLDLGYYCSIDLYRISSFEYRHQIYTPGSKGVTIEFH